MLKFLKMMVAEDVTIMEEVLVVVLAEVAQVVKEVLLQEEKEISLQEEKVLADLEANEIQLQEKVVSAEEVQLQERVVLVEEVLLQERVVFHLTEGQERKVHLKEHQEDRKVLVILQERKDQEKANVIC
jgi:hypothetical protein